VNKILRNPEVVQRLAAIGSDAAPTTPEGYAENLRRKPPRFERAVRISGAKVD